MSQRRAHAYTTQEPIQLMIPRNASIADVVEALQKKAGISDEVAKKIRMYEAHNNKVYKILSPESQVISIQDYLALYAWAPPEDESSKKITAFHYDKEPSKAHGIPFQFSLKEVCL